MNGSYVDVCANVSPDSLLGENVKIWGLAQIREGAKVGSRSVIGRGAYLGPGVVIGQNCKVQNYALIYEPAIIADGAFIGPGVIFTNDLNPRAVSPDGILKEADEWQAVGVVVGEGASIGAGSVCVAPIEIGAWSLVAAGSVVIDNVPSHALVMGVPARQRGWVGKSGIKLVEDGAYWTCPRQGEKYQAVDGVMTMVGKR